MKTVALITITALAVSCAGTSKSEKLVSLYDKDGRERVKVSEKALASIGADGNVSIVKLQKDSAWLSVRDALVSVSIVVSKSVIQGAAQSYMDTGRVFATK